MIRQRRLQVHDLIDPRRLMTVSRIVVMGKVVTVISVVRMSVIGILLDAAAVVTMGVIVAMREVMTVSAMHTCLMLIAGADMCVHIIERHQRHAEVQQHVNDGDEAAHDRQSNQTRVLCTTVAPAGGDPLSLTSEPHRRKSADFATGAE